MTKECPLTKKKRKVINNVSHSKRRTKSKQEANLQNKKYKDPRTGKVITLRNISTTAIRNIAKNGLESDLNRKNTFLLTNGIRFTKKIKNKR